MSRRIPFETANARCEASGNKRVYALAYVYMHEILRREHDARRVADDCDRIPQTELGRAMEREWRKGAARRRREIKNYRARLLALHESAIRKQGMTATRILDLATADALRDSDAWICVPGGSGRDG